MVAAPNDPRQVWIAKAEAKLAPLDQIRKRNQSITAAYVDLYERHRPTFKWAGMAAFASFQVGFALQAYQLLLESGIQSEWRKLVSDLRAPDDILADLNQIRDTNNAVHADIAWTHWAYESGGIDELRNCLGGQPEYSLVLRGFERIAEADAAIAKGAAPKTVDSLIWSGNALLLEHEQRVTVQPHFAKLHSMFRLALTTTTMLDFDANNARFDAKTLSSFSVFMFWRGLHVLLRTFSLPDVTRFEHRWFWIERRLLPTWQGVDQSDADLPGKLKRLSGLV